MSTRAEKSAVRWQDNGAGGEPSGSAGVHVRRIEVQTSKRMEIHDLTPTVQEMVRATRVSAGIVTVSTMHTTTAIFVTIALHLMLVRTRFGAQVRASVDNAVASAGLGINVNRVFGVTFAFGSGLAGLGGALGVDVLGLDPTFPLKYMVYFLLVVAIGGAGTIKGGLVAAMILGICDVAGKYYVPQVGSFIIYFLMVALMILFPAGLYGRRA